MIIELTLIFFFLVVEILVEYINSCIIVHQLFNLRIMLQCFQLLFYLKHIFQFSYLTPFFCIFFLQRCETIPASRKLLQGLVVIRTKLFKMLLILLLLVITQKRDLLLHFLLQYFGVTCKIFTYSFLLMSSNTYIIRKVDNRISKVF
jgi:hypothetical protein